MQFRYPITEPSSVARDAGCGKHYKDLVPLCWVADGSRATELGSVIHYLKSHCISTRKLNYRTPARSGSSGYYRTWRFVPGALYFVTLSPGFNEYLGFKVPSTKVKVQSSNN